RSTRPIVEAGAGRRDWRRRRLVCRGILVGADRDAGVADDGLDDTGPDGIGLYAGRLATVCATAQSAAREQAVVAGNDGRVAQRSRCPAVNQSDMNSEPATMDERLTAEQRKKLLIVQGQMFRLGVLEARQATAANL